MAETINDEIVIDIPTIEFGGREYKKLHSVGRVSVGNPFAELQIALWKHVADVAARRSNEKMWFAPRLVRPGYTYLTRPEITKLWGLGAAIDIEELGGHVDTLFAQGHLPPEGRETVEIDAKESELVLTARAIHKVKDSVSVVAKLKGVQWDVDERAGVRQGIGLGSGLPPHMVLGRLQGVPIAQAQPFVRAVRSLVPAAFTMSNVAPKPDWPDADYLAQFPVDMLAQMGVESSLQQERGENG